MAAAGAFISPQEAEPEHCRMRFYSPRFCRSIAVTGLLIFQTAALSFGEKPPTADSEITRLRAEIRRHDELYYRKAAPEITDNEYDLLKRKLAALENKTTPEDDISAAFGDDLTVTAPQAAHLTRMAGLAKVHTREAFLEFLNRTASRLPGEKNPTFVVEPKYDGLAISATYENGVLKRVLTRGDGTRGEEVTGALLARSPLPRHLKTNTTGTVELRGEAYMTSAEFRRINRARTEAGETPYAHPRNLAVGTLKGFADDPENERRLAVVFYGFGAWHDAGTRPESLGEFRDRLIAWGLPHIETRRVATSPEAVWTAIDDLRATREKLPYPIDGAVVKIDRTELQTKLGEAPDAPRWAIAYKFEPETATTRLRAIRLSIGRTGVITPVAEFDPVRLGGASVKSASLHNAGEIARRDLRIGDLITVEKAGDIIPVVTGADPAARPAESTVFAFPIRCPECAGLLTGDSGSGATRCPDEDCPARIRGRIIHFVSREAVAVSGLGAALVEKLVAAKKVRTPADLFHLTRADLIALPGVRDKSADKLLAAIEAAKSAEARRFVYGLGIPGVGAEAARKLGARFPSLPEFAGATREELASLDLGKNTEQAVAAHLTDPGKKALLAELIRQGCCPGKKTEAASAQSD